MPSQKNIDAVVLLKERLSRSTIIVGTSFTGLDGSAMTSLRQALREKGIEYRVVKNTVTAIAARESGRPEVEKLLQGATALALGYGDAVETARALNDYLRASRISLKVQGVVVERQLLGPNGVTVLAEVPPRATLAAQLLGQLVGVMARLVSTLNTPAQRLVSTLNNPSQGLVTVMQRHLEQVQAAKG